MAEIEKQIANGNIQAVNKGSSTVKVKSDATEFELGIDDNTTITINGYYRTISDLGSGQKIKKIYYVEKAGKKLATILHATDEKLLEIQKKKKGPAEKEERKPAI